MRQEHQGCGGPDVKEIMNPERYKSRKSRNQILNHILNQILNHILNQKLNQILNQKLNQKQLYLAGARGQTTNRYQLQG
jgi:hypothetical protein